MWSLGRTSGVKEWSAKTKNENVCDKNHNHVCTMTTATQEFERHEFAVRHTFSTATGHFSCDPQ